MTILQTSILEDVLLAGCTAFMSANLALLKYLADILVTWYTTRLRRQSGPIPLRRWSSRQICYSPSSRGTPSDWSLTSNHNPSGNILATSPLRRSSKGCSQITRLLLTQDYRSHPTLSPMPSGLFMTAAWSVRRTWQARYGAGTERARDSKRSSIRRCVSLAQSRPPVERHSREVDAERWSHADPKRQGCETLVPSTSP